MYLACRSLTSIGILGAGYPDGEPYLKQEVLLLEMFEIVESEVIASVERGKQKGQRGS